MINWSGLLQLYLLPWSINVGVAIAVFVIGRILVKIIVRVAKKFLQHAKVELILINFIGSVLGFMLMLVVVIAALDQLGVSTTSLVALIGAAGLAIGLALQGSLQNFASGVMLIIFRPFKNGDFIEAAGVAGVVEQIDVFNTRLRTGDNKSVIVPNGAIFSDNITNYSTKPTRRVDMVFGIGYNDDMSQAQRIISDILAADTRVLKDPAPVVAVDELADSSVKIIARPWCNSRDYSALKWDMIERIKLAFDQAEISMPYPQLDVHIPDREAA